MKNKFMLLIILMLILLTSVGCDTHSLLTFTLPKLKTYGDFLYRIVYTTEDGSITYKDPGYYYKEPYIVLCGLSEEGKQKEFVVVPRMIEGYEVKNLINPHSFIEDCWEPSENLKKIYVPCKMDFDESMITNTSNFPKFEKFIMVSSETDHRLYEGKLYLTSYHKDETENSTNFFYIGKYTGGGYCYFANVSFMYNYEGAENYGYYWIDDLDYGSLIEYIPDPPIREGYRFVAWYKDKECIFKWNFSVDRLNEIKYNSDGEVIYQELRLYAKWEEVE